ncbi:hypothetical protein [Chryseolinea lacunae]|uniref:Uncharacterized protein n=1 Tax=Chryseolinea lacunae TaxID=2801331 RepID=A0ABS1KNH4_9BACT|nr:hypothetical protein [Chryseolinea lacunae]MBL0740807.1 hypothetical protein [Chryseolinea lacunae]
MRITSFVFFLILSSMSAHAQIVGDMDETKLYAESKQVNQFFRRFNGEEDEKGNRYYPGDKQYRNIKLRKKYLGILFNESNTGMPAVLKTEFVKNVLDKSETSVLDFHGGNWFSEVHTVFTANGKDQPVTLFMTLEKDHLGSKWVIQKVYADMFAPYFVRDTLKVGRFLHPMSHELDFMNLRKAFVQTDSVAQFASKKFVPDHLSLFLYEVKKGTLKFKTVTDVKFHFFQLDGWYFELANFNRPGYNTGWLISNLVKLKNPVEKDVLRKYLYYETK